MENYTQNNVQGAGGSKVFELNYCWNAERYVTRIQTSGIETHNNYLKSDEDNETYNTKSYIWPVKDYEEAKNRLRVGGHKTSRRNYSIMNSTKFYFSTMEK